MLKTGRIAIGGRIDVRYADGDDLSALKRVVVLGQQTESLVRLQKDTEDRAFQVYQQVHTIPSGETVKIKLREATESNRPQDMANQPFAVSLLTAALVIMREPGLGENDQVKAFAIGPQGYEDTIILDFADYDQSQTVEEQWYWSKTAVGAEVVEGTSFAISNPGEEEIEVEVILIGYNNVLPVAAFTYDVVDNTNVDVDASSSIAYSGRTIVGWQWSSNSGVSSTNGPIDNFDIDPLVGGTPGTYEVSLRVTDSEGNVSLLVTQSILIPKCVVDPQTFGSPAQGATVTCEGLQAGDTWDFYQDGVINGDGPYAWNESGTIAIDNPGDYTFWAVAHRGGSDFQSDSIIVTVTE